MIVRSRYRIASVFLLLLWLGVGSDRAWATPVTFSTSLISGNVPLEQNGTTSSSVSDGQNSAGSFLVPLTGTMGASVSSDGSVFSVSTTTKNIDDWSCATGCIGPAASILLSATLDFHAVVSAVTPHEFSLTAQYLVAGIPFLLNVGADSSPVTAGASFGIDDVPVVMTTDPSSGNLLVSAHFVGGVSLTSCDGSQGPCGLFSDTQEIDLEMEGAGFVDASHTFSVTLAPTDPNVFLTSTDGRTAGTLNTVPEPATLFLFGAGLVPVMLRFRRRRPDPRRLRSRG